jgi:hypothetical protein
MKKIMLMIAAFGLFLATSCSNEVRKETTTDSTGADTTATPPDTTTMPPDTTRQN